MHKDWITIADTLSAGMKPLRGGIGDTMQAFSALAAAATKGGALDAKTKELLAVAISIAARCDGCIAFHTKAALRLGVTREELMETVGIALYMGGGPSLIYGTQCLEAYDQWVAEQSAGSAAE
ncbi:carboxymuconolactone decarboxylase family protein [Insolitispirillum peregrinum]|uniref:Alkylhydroperoxidase AhpD family core domain-containing protein n=1 Tax=Insolitispirillum peregrinum TaxID=80876 RepID=A0A1N7QB59_9PROT|nr:carboxymuconolactone decarboxylase family protein [Insolitispirillum peregrinum]SIT19969.1 alkylhydroperoxidase AhpD family core domain-containing protein [Insolitispirillum peregrinum]